MVLNLSSMQEALSDWLHLLQGPAEPPFVRDAEFQNQWQHLFRLIILVLIMTVAVMTFSYVGLTASEKDGILQTFATNTVGQTKWAIFIILLGALFAALYALIVAPLFKVKITIPQAFFTFLFLSLPWIPIVALVYVFGYVLPEIVFFIIPFIFVVFPAILVFRLTQGISLVSGSTKRRCLASVAIPFFLAYSLMALIALSSDSEDLDVPETASSHVYESDSRSAPGGQWVAAIKTTN